MAEPSELEEIADNVSDAEVENQKAEEPGIFRSVFNEFTDFIGFRMKHRFSAGDMNALYILEYRILK